jgi:RNA polymerase sigma-70 factor, ECF subfamily
VPTREIDDVVQQVFVVVHKNGGYVNGPATPTSYLGAIAVKAASSARRRDGAQRSRNAGYSPDSLASTGRDPVSLLEVRHELVQLQAALDEMDAELRVVLVLTELEGESCAAIAASQGIPVGTVYWRAHRARKQFRKIALRLSADPKPRLRPSAGSAAPAVIQPESEPYEPRL